MAEVEDKETKGRKKEFRKPTVKKEIEITRIVEEKQEKEEDLIKIRMVKEMVLRRFYKYLKIFEKKKSEKMRCQQRRYEIMP